MCGRLSPSLNNKIQEFPANTWQNEFQYAKNIGFESIEWVFDLHKNPIMYDDGVQEILRHSKKTSVDVNSICADYFMERKLFGVSESELQENIKTLLSLIKQCSKCEIRILELPFVDTSSLRNKTDQEQILQNLEPVLQVANDNDVIIALETDLSPSMFSELLVQFNHPKIMANYDVGNSTANCYDIAEEISTLKDWITNIHVKDRLRNGGTVPLGTGDTNFDIFFSMLKKVRYTGNLIIQGAREDLIDKTILPEQTCKKYFEFVKQYIDKYLGMR
jgi:hexulose-6-phosphate isomerase